MEDFIPLVITEDHFTPDKLNSSNNILVNDTFNDTMDTSYQASNESEISGDNDLTVTTDHNDLLYNNSIINEINTAHNELLCNDSTIKEINLDSSKIAPMNDSIVEKPTDNEITVTTDHNELLFNDSTIKEINLDSFNIAPLNDSIVDKPTDISVDDSMNINALYKYVNTINAEVINNKKSMRHVLSIINNLDDRVKTLQEKYDDIIPNLSARILLLETQKEKEKKSFKEDEKKRILNMVNVNKTRIGNLVDFSKRGDRMDEEFKSLSLELSKCKKGLNELMNIANEINPIPVLKDDVPSRKQHNPIDYSNTQFNHDFIFLVDSNLGKINPSIMNEGSSCMKVFCPTLKHINNLLDNTNIIKEPKSIFIHTGTNLFDEPGFSIEQMEMDYVNTIFKLKEIFPSSKIIISSILPRKEVSFRSTVTSLNDFLYGVCSSGDNMEFMRNINIKRFMLTDKKHVNEDGFKMLLSNIRFKVFGKTHNFRYASNYTRFNRY